MRKEKKTTETQQIAFIGCGHSQYDDTFWSLLGELDPYWGTASSAFRPGYDYLDLIDCFILAGASVNTVLSEFGDTQITLTIPKGKKEFESFLWRVRKWIIEKGKLTHKKH